MQDLYLGHAWLIYSYWYCTLNNIEVEDKTDLLGWRCPERPADELAQFNLGSTTALNTVKRRTTSANGIFHKVWLVKKDCTKERLTNLSVLN